jgi:hypothetical protein
MATSTTYTSLLDDLRRYLERGFNQESDAIVFEQLPRLISLAERRIAREMKLQGFIRVVESQLQVGQPFYQKPDRWRETISITVNGSPIYARSYEFCKAYWPDSSAKDVPAYYADVDYTRWFIVPTPVSAQSFEVAYYEQPEFLCEETQTNFLTEYTPDLLLYASLLEASPFLKNDSRIQTWTALYDRAAQALAIENRSRILDRASTRENA